MKNLPEGISLKRSGESIKISGLSTLPKKEALRVMEYVKSNKEDLLQEIINKEAPRIQPMVKCLHGGGCEYLNAPGDQRPLCDKVGSPVFDLAACPVLKWKKTPPRYVNEEGDKGPETLY
jgi:hypothetical protein